MKDYELEGKPKGDVEYLKEDIYKFLLEINPRENPEQYLNLLDKYEQMDLVEKQANRRNTMLGVSTDGTLNDFYRDD